ncbi:hypothetical protein RJ639_006133 [Escallonia herrerae]|uniref:glutathione transferase n=1 Tax=Escallonia herrerae TaxID=1293975 RepID=A0AA89AZK7_9ASTE|nr:hypothetical protein RJ639_006133 [Escallonia herrerae]
MVVKVFGPVAAACPQRVLACFLEMGVDFEVVHVDLESGEHKRPGFLLRQVLCNKVGRQRSQPARDHLGGQSSGGSMARSGSTQLQRLGLHHLLQLLVLPRMGDRTDFGLVQSCAIKLEKVLDVYEQRLSKSTYIAGDAFTLADLSHLPAMRYLTTEAGYGHLVRERKNVNSWWMNISARPAWKKVMHLMA